MPHQRSLPQGPPTHSQPTHDPGRVDGRQPMTMSWILQAAVISLLAGLGLGVAIRFSLVARVQDRTRRVAPQVGNVSTASMIDAPRRAPSA